MVVWSYNAQFDCTSDMTFVLHIETFLYFFQLACRKRLLTLDRVQAWSGVVHDKQCLLCHQSYENIEHLFFNCEYSRNVINRVCDWLQIANFSFSFNGWQHWMVHCTHCKTLKTGFWRASMATSVYLLQQEKNQHRGEARTPSQVLQHIQMQVLVRIRGLNLCVNDTKRGMLARLESSCRAQL